MHNFKLPFVLVIPSRQRRKYILFIMKQIYHCIWTRTTAPTILFLASPFTSDPTTAPSSPCIHSQCSTWTKRGKKPQTSKYNHIIHCKRAIQWTSQNYRAKFFLVHNNSILRNYSEQWEGKEHSIFAWKQFDGSPLNRLLQTA